MSGSTVEDAVRERGDAELAALFRRLIDDVNAVPCKYPCLRDDLHDWLRAHDERADRDGVTR